MNHYNLYGALLCLALLLAAAAALAALYQRRRTQKTMDTIARMLDSAMEGSFSEAVFDESSLSALETRFSHYLAASELSARNVAMEKDKIKTLIADISHQTKTPISNLLLYSELLAEGDLPEEQRANVEAIHHQTESLRFLIDTLVKMSRLENGILTLRPRLSELDPVLQAVCGEFSAKAEAKGLELSLQETGLSAVFDPKWTGEALGNLIDNAIKYTPSGSVSISAVAYSLFVRIDIADTGIGISEEEQAKIFSRFYRGEAAGDSDGVGIGLYLSREITTSQSGYIKVSSQVGHGSTFSVFLPRQSGFFQNC